MHTEVHYFSVKLQKIFPNKLTTLPCKVNYTSLCVNQDEKFIQVMLTTKQKHFQVWLCSQVVPIEENHRSAFHLI